MYEHIKWLEMRYLYTVLQLYSQREMSINPCMYGTTRVIGHKFNTFFIQSKIIGASYRIPISKIIQEMIFNHVAIVSR